MSRRIVHRNRLWGFVLVASTLLTTACIDAGAVPPVDPALLGALPAVTEAPVPSDAGPAVSGGGGGGVVDDYAPSYGHISQFLAANDAKPDGRGVTNTFDMSPQECRRTPSCAKDGGAGRIAQRNRLVTDVGRALDTGGGATIRLEGTVDNQNQRITGQDSIRLARNRALDTAEVLERRILQENPDAQVFIGKETRGAACGSPGVVCIETGVHAQVVNQCTDERGGFLPRCEKGGSARQRGTIASAVFSVPADPFGSPRATPEPAGSAGAATSGGRPGGGSGDESGTDGRRDGMSGGGPNPGEGIFGQGPAGSQNGNGGPAGTNPTGAGEEDTRTTFRDDSEFYCSTYPEDCPDVDGDDPLSVRITVDTPGVFRVGGKLREQNIEVVNVVLYCGNSPCPAGGSISLATFRGELGLASSSDSYRLCRSPRSTGCAYYISDAASQQPEVVFDGSSLQGGVLRAGFLSPTPSGSGTPVKVRPLLVVEVLDVEWFVPVRKPGPACNTGTPPRDCWDWLLVGSTDERGSVSVRTSTGERFVRDGDTHRLDRVVVGTVGS